MNAKIRNAQKMQVPYMLVVGDQEMEAGTVAPRLRSGKRMECVPANEWKRSAWMPFWPMFSKKSMTGYRPPKWRNNTS